MFPIKILKEIPTPELKSESAPESTFEPTLNPTIFDTAEPTKAQLKKSKHKISPLKLHESFVNKIENHEKNINKKIFREYFGYHNLPCFTNDLHFSQSS